MKPYLICYSLVLFCGSLFLSSCDAIIEPSISKKTVQAEAPSDLYQSPNYTINFWWDEVDNALSYHLQVVTPTYSSPGSLILDTIIKKNTFSFTLNPGNYQWRILAQNGSSQTAYTVPRSFTVVPSSIAQQTVTLNAPASNAVTNQVKTTFQWASIYGATKYLIEIDTNNFINENSLVYSQEVPGQQVIFTFSKDQTYQWRVRAENDSVKSQWSAINILTYDHTPPATVTLTAPANGITVPLPVTLQWGAVASAAAYKLYVYKSDGTTNYNQNFPMNVTATTYSFNLGNSGDKVFWTVTAVDAAGNESQPPAELSFVLQ